MAEMTDKKRTLIKLLAIVGFMGAMSFASVPLYDIFCRVTGYGGTTQQADTEADEILDQVITVRFDASKSNDLMWSFKPVQNSVDIRIGETGLAFYRAKNLTDQVLAGTATFNVAPFKVGGYFVKIDCFCFEEQVLQPGQEVDMPVTFYVDPAIVKDDTTKNVTSITLSYSMFPKELTEKLAQIETTE